MKYIVIRTETKVTTEVFEVEADTKDHALSATTRTSPIAGDYTRDVKFQVLEKK